MNQVTTIERTLEAVVPDDMAFAAWVEEARILFADHRNAEWKVAEWLRVGIERFHDEPQMDLFLDQIGVDKKRAIADAKVAKLIPASWRSDRVSFEVCNLGRHLGMFTDKVETKGEMSINVSSEDAGL